MTSFLFLVVVAAIGSVISVGLVFGLLYWTGAFDELGLSRHGDVHEVPYRVNADSRSSIGQPFSGADSSWATGLSLKIIVVPAVSSVMLVSSNALESTARTSSEPPVVIGISLPDITGVR